MTTSRIFGLSILAIVALSTSPASIPCVSASPSYTAATSAFSAPAHRVAGINAARRLLTA